MHYSTRSEIVKKFGSDEKKGLTETEVVRNRKYGENVLTKVKPPSVFARILSAVSEPMMLILVFALVLTIGINVGKALRTGDGDFYECVGIFAAIAVSVSVTVVMEDKSRKALEFLSVAGGEKATVTRNGKKRRINACELVVGDIVSIEAGDKIYADMRLLSSENLKTDEAVLTGESAAVRKDAEKTPDKNAPLAERINCVYSGTFVKEGRGTAIVTAVGDSTETGLIAKESNAQKSTSAPLNAKLSKLGKTVSIFGGAASAAVFLLSLVRLAVTKNFTFDGVGEAFVQSILLIVAAVPEGLPATVAVSLTLNVVRLAKSNALIKKLVAAETIGGVSVICSDKTGTLTVNKMTTEGVYGEKGRTDARKNKYLLYNFSLNTTAEKGADGYVGSGTECALLEYLDGLKVDYGTMRKTIAVRNRQSFNSENKFMTTEISVGGENVVLFKGAPEKAAEFTGENPFGKEIAEAQAKGMRVLAFAHEKAGKRVYDGYVTLCDDLRSDAKSSVEACLKAGVKVKILTGDGKETARYIAEKLTLKGRVVEAKEIENLSDEQLLEVLKNTAVVARSTPKIKLRIVEVLKNGGEVVAVTGDGVNDAPAIRHADVGIAMGSGADVTKEAAEVVLLDDKFSTIVKAIAFGRGVFDNFQRFISFQLTVNLASMSIIIASLLTGLDCPFTSTGLLWLNVIMDGPLALSLGVEKRGVRLETTKPVKRDADILTPLMMTRIALHSAFMCLVTTSQQLFNFLDVNVNEQSTVVLTTFVFFQLFNAINCSETGKKSAFKGLFGNKLLLIMLVLTFTLHILLCQFVPVFFSTTPLSLLTYAKILLLCSSVAAFSELYKAAFRFFAKRKKSRPVLTIKRNKVA